MPHTKANETATDFWRQYFANQAKSRDAALVDPEHDHAIDLQKLREGLAEAGWSTNEIDWRLSSLAGDHLPSVGNSPGVLTATERSFNRLCDDVEGAMARLNLTSHTRLARGIEPVVGPSAAMTNVIMTEEGVISVSAFFFRFCGLMSRAFTRTLQINPVFWESPDYRVDDGLKLLFANPKCAGYWTMAFCSFASTGTQILAPFRPATKTELLLFEQIARAMELFAIAHEYGHHHFSHGRDVKEDPFATEYEADRFAIRILYEIETRPLLYPNPYIPSGAGALILLRCMEILQRVKEVLTGAKPIASGTHPAVADRIVRFETVSLLKPEEYAALKSFRTTASRIMDVVENIVLELTNALPEDALQQLRHAHAETFTRPAF